MNPRARSRLAGGLVLLLGALHVFAEGGAFTLASTASGHELKTPGGQLVLHFYSEEELEALYQRLIHA